MKKVAIAGYAVEGKVNYAYWAQQPDVEITIADQRQIPADELPEGVKTIMGPDAFTKLQDFDLVVRTASLPPRNITTNGVIWSATNEFMAQCPAPVIGVTGTKGKGTTSTMIATILRQTGKEAWLVGNIGVSAIETLPKINAEDYVVFEMSSFQLWDLKKSPHVAVVLGIEPDHLNVHTDMEDYVMAKGQIRANQQDDDICVYHYQNNYARQIAELTDKGIAMPYAQPSSDPRTVYVEDGHFRTSEYIICSTDTLRVPGVHNIENACAALTVAVSLGVDVPTMTAGIAAFEGLPHRLEKVREKDGVIYYNDSFSSAPTASVAAIAAFTQPERVIIGGVDKGADFEPLAQAIAQAKNIAALYLIGEQRHRLHELFRKAAPNINYIICDEQTMPEIVNRVAHDAQPGEVVILSPGCASFDMFRDFYDRGDQFRAAVQAL